MLLIITLKINLIFFYKRLALLIIIPYFIVLIKTKEIKMNKWNMAIRTLKAMKEINGDNVEITFTNVTELGKDGKETFTIKITTPNRKTKKK